MPTDNRATAERIARDFAAVINSHSAENDSDTPDFILSNALTAMLDAMQRAIVARDDWYGGKPGMAHRDRTAEREAASKAWDAAIEAARQWDVPRSFGVSMERERDKFLAAEFDAGERVMLPDGSVVWRDPLFAIWCRTFPAPDFPSRQCTDWRQLLNQPTDTGAYFDAVKRLAEQRGAER